MDIAGVVDMNYIGLLWLDGLAQRTRLFMGLGYAWHHQRVLNASRR
jgi:hypothetical protein